MLPIWVEPDLFACMRHFFAVWLLFAAHKRGKDAERRDGGADDKGGVKGGRKGVL